MHFDWLSAFMIDHHNYIITHQHARQVEALFGEDLDYDCIKGLEEGRRVSPSNGRCWGDAGNGVQIGWWVWAQAVLRRKLGVL